MATKDVNLKAQQLSRVMEALLSLDGNMPVIQGLIFLYVASQDRGTGTGPNGLAIAEALKIDATRVSRNLTRLTSAGLIAREMGDMGQKRNHITKAGWSYVERLASFIN